MYGRMYEFVQELCGYVYACTCISLCVCVCVCMHQYQFIFTEHQKKLWETTRLSERNVITIFPSSFKAEDNTVEKRNKRWYVKYALKYCVTPEKLHAMMSDIEQK